MVTIWLSPELEAYWTSNFERPVFGARFQIDRGHVAFAQHHQVLRCALKQCVFDESQ